ncbi:MAG: hypothetical protein HQL58_02970 [Magnetococcales bacterium]|nr:hypothetical protein [Magnetococcales bacterium]
MKQISYNEVPIIINSFNKKTCLELLLNWLREYEYKRIFIIDNASTYQPLLKYYDELLYNFPPNVISIAKLSSNYGPFALWNKDLLRGLGIESEFVYTDSTVVPDENCPGDVVGYLQNVLVNHSTISSIGLGVRVDDIPQSNSSRDAIQKMESRLWQKPAMRGFFWAESETTFTLYRPLAQRNSNPASIRSGYPYLARRTSWYTNSLRLTEEEGFCATATGYGAKHAHQGTSDTTKQLLHLGCGRDYFPGWINLDMVGCADIHFNLDNCGEEKIPLSDDQIDGFYMSHLFEHIRNPLTMMEELWRIAKNGAQLIIRLPYGSSDDAFEDPTYVRPYFETSFHVFSQSSHKTADYGYRADWHTEKIMLIVPKGTIGEIAETYKQIKQKRNIVREMVVMMRAVKPARLSTAKFESIPTVIIDNPLLEQASFLW